MRPLVAQLRLELTLLARNGESLLLTLGIPILLLVFFANVDVLPIDGEPIDFLAPGVLALAVLSTSLVNLAIATGFEREYGVLKRLGTTPLGRPRLLTAKTLAILVVQVVQIAVLWLIALALGWDPDPRWGFIAAVALGTMACAGPRPVPGRLAQGPRHARRRQRPLPGAAPPLRHGHPARGAPGPGASRGARPAERRAGRDRPRHADRRRRRPRPRVGRPRRVGGRRAAPRHPPLPLGVRASRYSAK